MQIGHVLLTRLREPSALAKLRSIALEFAIVLAGVFAAQALADWVARRAAFETMESAKARAELEISGDLGAATIYLAAVPCLRTRLEQVLQQASIGPLRGRLADRPTLRGLYFSGFTDANALLLRQRYGDDYFRHVEMVRANSEMLGSRVQRIGAAWGRMTLADPTYGVVAPGDRLAARAAAADIVAELRGVEVAAANIVEYGSRLGLKPRYSNAPGHYPTKSCEAIWDSGRIDPPVAMPPRA